MTNKASMSKIDLRDLSSLDLPEYVYSEWQALDANGDEFITFTEAQGSIVNTPNEKHEFSIESESDFILYEKLIKSYSVSSSVKIFQKDLNECLPNYYDATTWLLELKEKDQEVLNRSDPSGTNWCCLIDSKETKHGLQCLVYLKSMGCFFTVSFPKETSNESILVGFGDKWLKLSDFNCEQLEQQYIIILIYDLIYSGTLNIDEDLKLRLANQLENNYWQVMLHHPLAVEGQSLKDFIKEEPAKYQPNEIQLRADRFIDNLNPVVKKYKNENWPHEITIKSETPLSEEEFKQIESSLDRLPINMIKIFDKLGRLDNLEIEIVSNEVLSHLYNGGTLFGACYSYRKRLALNRDYLMGDTLLDTLSHELSHYLFEMPYDTMIYLDKRIDDRDEALKVSNSLYNKNSNENSMLLNECDLVKIEYARLEQKISIPLPYQLDVFPAVSVYAAEDIHEFWAVNFTAFIMDETQTFHDRTPTLLHGETSRQEIMQKHPTMYLAFRLFCDEDSAFFGEKTVFDLLSTCALELLLNSEDKNSILNEEYDVKELESKYIKYQNIFIEKVGDFLK